MNNSIIWVLGILLLISIGTLGYLFEKTITLSQESPSKKLVKENEILSRALDKATNCINCEMCPYCDTCCKGLLSNAQCVRTFTETERQALELEAEKKSRPKGVDNAV